VHALLKRTLVILLALRALAAPVGLCPSTPVPSHHRFFAFRMRCWPPQQLQRFSSSSKLLELCTGKSKVTSGAQGRFVTFWRLTPPPQRPSSVPVLEASRDVSTDRSAVCLRC
jgi:hypothetical protein